MAALREADEIFALVVDDDQPQTLITEDQLDQFADVRDQSLGECLDRLPPLLILDEGVKVLETEELKHFARLLHETQAPGWVIYRDDEVLGVLSRRTIRRGLSIDAIFEAIQPRLDGDVNVGTRTYVCHQCPTPPPPPRRRPRDGSTPPHCPRNRDHGPMERESS
jgi:hypothetical protein